LAQPELGAAHAEVVDEPVEALPAPVVEQLAVLARLAEVLHLHLLELAQAEDEVAGADLVAEAAALLGDAEGQAAAGGVEHVGEVDEHALRRLGTEVDLRSVLLDGAEEGLEHQVELARLGERPVALRAELLRRI